MDDQAAAVQLFEMEQALENDQEVSAAALAAAETLSDREEFDSLVLGQVYLGNFAERVAEPSRTPVDFTSPDEVEVSAEGLDDALFRAAHGFPPEPEESPADRVLKLLAASPEYQRARAEFVERVAEPERIFAKRCSTEKTPKACGPGMIRCGENTAKVERAGNFVTEYDENGNLLRGYSLED